MNNVQAFLHGKLAESEQLVQKSIDLLSSRAGNDTQTTELKRSLQALKLKELEVDVASVQLPLHQELATLRSAVDGGAQQTGGHGSAPVPPIPMATNSGPSPEDLEKMRKLEAENRTFRDQSQEDANKVKKLEAENKSLRDQLKDVEARLSASNDAISKANGNASELANSEIKALKSQIDALKRDVAAKEAQSTEKESTIAAHARTIATLTQEAQSRSASDSSKEQALRSEVEKARADSQQLEAKILAVSKDFEAKSAAANRDWEAKVAAKTMELSRVAEDKAKALEEQEARLEAEKEEMMEAMAQEIEVSDFTH